MKRRISRIQNAIPRTFLLLAMAVLIVIYIIYTWITVKNEAIENAFQIARSIKASYPIENLQALEINSSDIEKPEYQALKKSLKAVIKANPKARFAYIYVERNNKIYFVADSEPEDSEDYSPPGQEYLEAKPQDKQPFRDGEEHITSPLTDRWGTWRSVLIPVKDDISGETIAVFGMDFNARAWNGNLVFKVIQSSSVILLLLAILFVLKFQTRNKLLFQEITKRKKAEKKLTKSLDRNKALLGANPDIMFIFDSECRIVDFHAESKDQLLLPPELFMGKTIDDLFPPGIAEMAHSKVNAVLSGKQSAYSTYELIIEGKIQYFESRYELCGSDQVLAIVRDISEGKKAEEALRASEERLRLVMSAAKQGFYDLNTQTGDIVVNEEYATMLGYDPKTFIETNSFWIERLHPDDISVTSKAYTDYMEGKISEYRVEFRQKTTDNNWKWILSVGKIVETDPEGKPLRMLGTHVDITERKLAELEVMKVKQQYETLATKIPVGIYILHSKLDGSFMLDYVSPRMSKILNVSTERLLADVNLVLQSIHPDDLDGFVKLNNQGIKLRLPFDWTGRIRVNGTIKWLHFSSVPELLENGDILWHGLIEDITERKLAETEIQLKTEELINLNATKDKFFSIIAHDLRSPFNGFLGLTQIMAEELPTLTMSEIQNIAVNLSKSATNIYRLLENLLQWSQIQRGTIQFNPEKLQLRTAAQESILMFQETANIKGVEIINSIPEETWVFADNNILQTVIRNLVSNGVKYTEKGGNVILSAQPATEGFVKISVKDSGIGMSREILGNLFRIDQQNNRKGTEGEPSTGLGLLLCKEFVEKHEGSIWVESEVNKGSTFSFTLPVPANIGIS